jgi:hypothetical protein
MLGDAVPKDGVIVGDVRVVEVCPSSDLDVVHGPQLEGYETDDIERQLHRSTRGVPEDLCTSSKKYSNLKTGKYHVIARWASTTTDRTRQLPRTAKPNLPTWMHDLLGKDARHSEPVALDTQRSQ